MHAPTALTGPALTERFARLDAFLAAHQHLWRPRPFTESVLPWEKDHPQLAAWLRSRTLEQAERDHDQPNLLADAPAPFLALADQARRLAEVPELPDLPLPVPPAAFSVDVPGRKWRQIEAFAGRLQFTDGGARHWLDWCAGKGHLGRLLARDGTPLTSLEWDPALVQESRKLSDRLHVEARHHCQDVLAEDVAEHLTPEHTPVALHACGDLHVRLLQLASAAGCRQIAVAPCCYNRIRSASYVPLSRTARASSLCLSQDDLGLPLTETVTAGARIRRQRDRSMAWRLGFDLLQRRLRGLDEYLSVPSLPVAWLGKSFSDYCCDLAGLKGLAVAGQVDWQGLEQAGWQRLAQVRNLELVRALFRRPLELWLLLDRALYLQETGYQVRLGTFCERRLTPRNLLILAER